MAFTRDWNEAAPTDATYAVDIDDYNRYLRIDVSDRLKNMIYGFIAGENSYAQHFQYLDFRQQSSSPSQPAADFLRLYVKAVSNVSELFWRDDVNSEKQLTSGGQINITAADIPNDTIDSQHYAADSIDNEHLADKAVDTEELENDAVDGTKIADDSIDSEHIVDGSVDAVHIANIDPDSYAGEESVTLANGLIIKMGTVARTDTNTTVTFEAAFSGGIVTVVVCGGIDHSSASEVSAHTLTTSSFKINNANTSQTTMNWIAIGY